jgi:hypothetical protein
MHNINFGVTYTVDPGNFSTGGGTPPNKKKINLGHCLTRIKKENKLKTTPSLYKKKSYGRIGHFIFYSIK